MGKFANQPVRGNAAAKQRAVALVSRAPHGATVVELGTNIGAMAERATDIRSDIKWIMVDNWLPEDQQPEQYRKTLDDNAMKSFARCQQHKSQAFTVAFNRKISIMEMSTLEAAAMFADSSVDIVFIDADHSYEGVRADIEAWLSKVKPGGWLGGHDYQNIDPRFGGVDRAVDEVFPLVEKDLNYTWWHKVD